MTSLLIVDLCGTIVRENTTHEFLRALDRDEGRWRRSALLSRGGLAFGNLLPALDHRGRLVASLRGIERGELQRQASVYAHDALRRAARVNLLERIRANPDVVLASASIDVVVAAFASALNIPRWVATQLQYDASGRCTGTIQLDATGRKRVLVERLLGQALCGHAVVTDNLEDEDLRPGAATFQLLNVRD